MVLNDENFEKFIQSTPLVVHSLNSKGTLAHVSQPWLQLMGFELSEVLGRQPLEFLSDNSKLLARENMRKLFSREIEVVNAELQFLAKNGQKIDMIVVGKSEFNIDGQFIRITAYLTDITKQKVAENEVKELNQKLKMAMKISKVGIWDLHIPENKLYWDEQMFEVFGVDRSNFTSDYEAWINTLHPEERDDVVKHVDKVIKDGIDLDTQFRIIDKHGEQKYIRAVGTVNKDDMGNTTRMLGMNFDISREKNIQEELRVLNEKMKIALHTSKVGIWSWDIKTNSLEWDEQMLEMYGFDGQSFTGDINSWLCTIHPDDKDRALNQMENFSNSNDTFDTELKIIRNSDKETRFLRSVGKMLFDEYGQPNQMIGMSFDITADKTAEADLKLTNDRLQIAMHSSQAAVWDWDVVNDLLYWDDKMYEIYGLEKNENNIMGSEQWFNCLHPDDFGKLQRDMESTLQGTGIFTSEFRIVASNGSAKYIKSLGKTIQDKNGFVLRVIGMNFDVTEERRASKALAHALKFAALGEMAGEVAHEINNPLTIIDGYVDKVKRTLAVDDAQSRKDLDKVSHTIQRIASIIKGLRKYTRDSSMDESNLHSVREIITETIDLTSEKFKSLGIKLNVNMHEDYCIKCRPVEISQMLLNLINNSVDAIKGTNSKWICINVSKQHSDVIIEVIDSGEGIPEAIRPNILSRFYTTKSLGEGTGMGLSIAKGIVESHGGQLFLDEEARNTKFVVSFPEVLESL